MKLNELFKVMNVVEKPLEQTAPTYHCGIDSKTFTRVLRGEQNCIIVKDEGVLRPDCGLIMYETYGNVASGNSIYATVTCVEDHRALVEGYIVVCITKRYADIRLEF